MPIYDLSEEIYKTVTLEINDWKRSYTVYWGEPEDIFNEKDIERIHPLAITIIPKRLNLPDTHISLHNRLKDFPGLGFEFVIAHELGHIWLHDVLGFNFNINSPSIGEFDSEVYADFFAYSFFKNYRGIKTVTDLKPIFDEIFNIQTQTYTNLSLKPLEDYYIDRLNYLSDHDSKFTLALKNKDTKTLQIEQGLELTINSLGQLFLAK